MTAMDWLSLVGIVGLFGLVAFAFRPERPGTPRIRRAQHLHMRACGGRLVECRVVETEEEDI